MPKISGAQFLADTLQAYGVTHVFFVPAILSHTLAEMESRTDIRRVLTHGEKAAVYMADGYARAGGRPLGRLFQAGFAMFHLPNETGSKPRTERIAAGTGIGRLGAGNLWNARTSVASRK